MCAPGGGLVNKTRDKQFNNYQREVLAAKADKNSALIAGFIAGLLLFLSIIGVYIVLLLLMGIMGTFLSLPNLKEIASKQSAVIGVTGDVKVMIQGLLSLSMLFSMIGARCGNLNREDRVVTIWNFKFGKDFLPYYLLSVFLIGAFFVNWLPQATITIVTLSDNTGSVPFWGVLLIIIGLAIPPSLLLYETWWYWYKKTIPFWVKDKETLLEVEEKTIETAN